MNGLFLAANIYSNVGGLGKNLWMPNNSNFTIDRIGYSEFAGDMLKGIAYW